ncbi:MAG TPA: 4Fe-4S dicluster domain-containing protein [Methanomicrobia archaeon]|nr:4Fe-4S dicluster domain-containing protein [Methanomicrobia archaeon]
MKLLLKFPLPLDELPYTAEVILETGVKMSIDTATRGELIIDVPNKQADQVVDLFRAKGIEVRRLLKLVAWNDERCVHCGACISVCPTEVFAFDPSWTLTLDEEKCVRCEMCVKACPRRALTCVT